MSVVHGGSSAPGPGGAVVPRPPRAHAGGAWPGWALGTAVVLGLFAILGLLSDAFATGPQGPASSSYATSRGGLAAWAELLTRAGHRVAVVRDPLSRAALARGSTVVVLDPDALLPADGRHLADFVRGGGRLIIGGREPTGALGTVLAAAPVLAPGADPLATPVAGATGLAGVSRVLTAATGAWAPADGAKDAVLLRDRADRPILLRRRLGAGVAYLLADPSPLQNQLLGAADNASLALDLAGAGRPVLFAESVHGFGQRRGLAALPGRWRVALVGLALAGLAWVLARGRRLGPPERMPVAPAPPRRAFVDALALLLRRTRDSPSLAVPLRAAIDRELVARSGRLATSAAAERERALRRLGVGETELQALAHDGASDSDEQLIALGTTLARVRRGR